ncbi:MAG TPA: alkaline phosphatase family protein [Candidatus Tectomicrobia bacterium]
MARQDHSTPTGVTRRHVLTHLAGIGAALAVGFKPRTAAASQQDMHHIVLVMMENRSFDHFLGWVPGADGQQAGLTYLDRSGQPHATAALAPDYQGCSHPDPDHSYDGGRIEYNHGACDGWLRAGENDAYAIGYYTAPDLPLYAGLAQHWLTCDGYFAAIMAPSYPNRIYQHAAQTDRIDQSVAISSLPTIWDLLASHGLQGRYYYTDLPTLALWGSTYRAISHPLTRFLSDCQAGTLPHVAFVDPKFVHEAHGTSWDDHPHADIRNGQAFVNLIYEAVVTSPNWPNTVLVINYDEWGGFFDHVPPTAAPIPPADQAAGNQDGLRGFRVPTFIVSPWTPRGTVGHGLYDHTSVLRMIEWRWDLPPLTVRDATANNLADLLDFSHTQLEAPAFAVPGITLHQVCPVTPSVPNPWERLRQLARRSGFLTD